MRWDRKMPNRIIDRGKDEWRVMHSSEEVGGEGGGGGSAKISLTGPEAA